MFDRNFPFHAKLRQALRQYKDKNGDLSILELTRRIGGINQQTISALLTDENRSFYSSSLERIESFLRKVGMHPDENIKDRPFITAQNLQDMEKMSIVPISEGDSFPTTEEKIAVFGIILATNLLTIGQKMRILHTLYPDTSLVIRKNDAEETTYP